MGITTLIQGIAVLAIMAAIGLFVLAIMRAGQGRPAKQTGLIALVLIVAGAAFFALGTGLVTIDPQERGIVVSYLSPKGYRDQILQPGLRWILPGFEHVVVYPISKQTYTMSIAPSEGQITGDDSVAARTADGQEIYVDASVIYEINRDEVITVHIAWQDRYIDELVRPQSRGIIRNAVAQFKVEEVITSKRAEMIQQIYDTLKIKLEENGITLVDFVLRNITFSTEYAASVEQKQIAEQLALQAAYVVQQKQQEAQQAIETAKGQAESVKINAQGAADARLIQAEAEAQALQMINEALKDNPDLLTYLYITKLAPNVQVIYLPSGQSYIIPLPEVTTPYAAPTPTP